MQNPNTVLGIDPGIGNTGWSVVKHAAGKYKFVESGVILTHAHAPIGKRLETHYKMIRQLMTEHSPNLVSIESVYFNRNISSCLSTASVIAIVELAAHQSCVSTLQIKPQSVKAAVTGNGSADKSQVMTYVNRLLNTDIRRDHEADRDAEIHRRYAAGESKKGIATALKIGQGTVKRTLEKSMF